MNVQITFSYMKENVLHHVQKDTGDLQMKNSVKNAQRIVKHVQDQTLMNVHLALLDGTYMKDLVLLHAQMNTMVKIDNVIHVTLLVILASDHRMDNVILVIADSISTLMDTLVLKNVKMDISPTI